jgi:coenzyme F420-reducing hydrogenase gamma subunit
MPPAERQHTIRGRASSGAGARPRIGVAKLTSCDGCQLTLLDLEDHLLQIADAFELVEFPEATSNRSSGPYDVLLVEGSVSTPEQADWIVELRRRAGLLVTIGACATAGGIQALRNWGNEPAWRASVYPRPELLETLATSTPVSDHVAVDAELRGCPIDPGQLLELLAAVRTGRRPQLADEAVCLACKRRGTVCVVVARGIPCLGPVTQTGCGAICPAYGRGCYACFGPREQPNLESLVSWFTEHGVDPASAERLFAGFTGYAPPFREAAGAATRRAHGEEGPSHA